MLFLQCFVLVGLMVKNMCFFLKGLLSSNPERVGYVYLSRLYRDLKKYIIIIIV
jgi:hypothetical protein